MVEMFEEGWLGAKGRFYGSAGEAAASLLLGSRDVEHRSDTQSNRQKSPNEKTTDPESDATSQKVYSA